MRTTSAAVALAAAAWLLLAPSAVLGQDAPPPGGGTSSDEAISALEARARAADGDARADAYAALATALESAGRPAEAANAWRAAGKSKPSSAAAAGEARALLAFAEEILTAGDAGSSVRAAFEDARRALERAKTSGADDAATALGLARCAAAEGRADEEIALLRDAAARYAADPAPRRALAFAYFNAGRHADAIPVFRELAEKDPTDLRLLLCLAASGRATKDEALALGSAERAIRAQPADRRGWEALWSVYGPEKRWGELYERLAAHSAAEPANAFAAHYAGYAALSAQRTDDALRFLETAWSLDPRDLDAKLDAARLLLTAKHDRDRASKLVGEVLAAAPGSAKAHDLLSFVALRRSDDGDHAGAVRELETLAAARPDDPLVFANLGLERRWAGLYREADGAYARALELAPHDAIVHNDHGLLLLVLGRADDARARFLAGHEADPRANDVMENLGWLARERGDAAEAASWYGKAYRAALARGEDGARHRRHLDDVAFPLPPVGAPR
jgi:tetratricopeptide (TPR) repeat protein